MSPSSYAPSQKVLHWLIFMLVIGIYALTYVVDLFPRGDPTRDAVWWLHKSFGLTLVVAIFVRLGLRMFRGTPPLPSSMLPWERTIASIAHLLLYALLILIPLLGIFLTWYRGDTLSFFGMFTIGSPVLPNRETAKFLKELHNLSANAILILAGFHGAAALWHHYIRKDSVLMRMLPRR